MSERWHVLNSVTMNSVYGQRYHLLVRQAVIPHGKGLRWREFCSGFGCDLSKQSVKDSGCITFQYSLLSGGLRASPDPSCFGSKLVCLEGGAG